MTQKPPMTLDSICLQKGMVYLTEIQDTDNLAMASTVQSLLMGYGYMLTPPAFISLRYASQERILEFHNNVMSFLKHATGGKHNYTPLYGDFPISVMEKEDAHVMMDAVHYYSQMGSFDDFASTLVKPVAFENIKYTKLTIAVEIDVDKIFTDLVSVNTSLLPQDVDVIKWFIESGRQLILPDYIPFKENLCTLAALGIESLPIKTPTDVLRIAVHMSGGDISLPAVPSKEKKAARSPWLYTTGSKMVANPERELFKFRNFKRPERRYLLSLLEQTHCDPKEMVLKDQRWIRLGEILHPGEYSKQYPKAAAAFHAIRNTKVTSWYGKLANYKTQINALNYLLLILSERPGEFARRLDWLIRKMTTSLKDVTMVLDRFKLVSESVSNKVLYELFGHFSRRDKAVTNRTVMIKGARKKTKLPDLPAMASGTVNTILNGIVETLVAKYSKLEPLGKVWIDSELYKIPLPTNMRTVDFSLKPTIRGQRVPIGDADSKVIRAFFHWHDRDGSLDPDLSVTFVGLGKTEVLSYSRTRVGMSVHSGDIIGRRGHNAEYVDIHIGDAKNMGFKYAVVDVRNYRGGSLREMDGMFGLMGREVPEANDTWKPDTVANCHATDSSASNTMLSIIDLETMEYIYLGIDSAGTTYASGDTDSILDVIKQYSEDPKVSVAHLLNWHTKARGELVLDKEDADTIFEYNDFAQSYEKVGALMGV